MTTPALHEAESFLTTQQLARLLHRKEQTIRAWRLRGHGPRYVRLGEGLKAPVVYRWCDVEEWLEARTFRHTAEEVGKR
jgi:predicted DNA-binding transcriptional regulator AlpA